MYAVRIDATVRELNGFRPEPRVRRLRRTGKRMKIDFQLHAECRGRHYVEAYVVKNGGVIATDHHDVEID